jgi:signal recognition particle receptor subunit beta
MSPEPGEPRTMPPAARSAGDAGAGVREILGRTRELATTYGLHDVVARLDAEELRLAADEVVTVVVAAETSRGKSTLVNALVGQPGLLPVDADVATGVYVLVGHAESPRARVIRVGAQEAVDVSPDDLTEWVSVVGNPGNRKGVSHVEVGVAAPVLQGLVLVDTPGVGGLDPSHAAVTLNVLSSADALLFVLDAAAPLSKPELAFLETASERVDRVLLVLTKRDLFPGWPTVLDEDRTLIADHAPRFAALDIQPVASLVANRGIASLRAGDQEKGLRLLDQSGVIALRAQLRGVVAHGARLRVANAARVTRSSLEQVRRACSQTQAALDGDREPLEELERQQEKWRLLSSATEDWRELTANRFGQAQRAMVRQLQDQVSPMRREQEQRITNWRHMDRDTFADDVGAAFKALASDLQIAVTKSLEQCVSETAESLGLEPWKLDVESQLLSEREPPKFQDSVVGPSGKLGMTQSLVQFVLGLAMNNPYTMFMAPLQFGQSAVAARQRRTQVEQQEARRLVNEFANDVTRDCSNGIDDAFRSAQLRTVQVAREAIKTELQSSRAQIEALTSKAAEIHQQDEIRARLQADGERIAGLLREVDHVLAG